MSTCKPLRSRIPQLSYIPGKLRLGNWGLLVFRPMIWVLICCVLVCESLSDGMKRARLVLVCPISCRSRSIEYELEI